MTEPLPFVLVHGAWHGAWCWSALQAELDRRGLASYAIDLPGHGASTLPLGDLHDDAAHVAASLDALGRDVVLVGHSYGGAVITEAAVRTDRARHLVYLTAFVPDTGENVLGLLGSFPPAEVAISAAIVPRDDGTTVIDPALAVAAFYANCPTAVAAAAIQRLSPQTMVSFGQPTTGAGWQTTTSTYVRCTEDQAIHIDHQTIMASRCSDVRTLHTDHSPFASAISETADILEPIARS
jgi:pimeloyl-ACP methyl ester carboxylesterase